MSREGLPQPREILSPEVPTTFFFISGTGGTEKAVQEIGKSLHAMIPEENIYFDAVGSIVSSDKPQPNRLNNEAVRFKAAFDRGNVKVVAHSLGAAQLALMLNNNKELLNDPNISQKLELFLIGPAGMEAGAQPLARSLKGLRRILDSQAGMKIPGIPLTAIAGIETISIVPIQGIHDYTVFAERLRMMFEADSHQEDELDYANVHTFTPDNRYYEQLSPQQKDELAKKIDGPLMHSLFVDNVEQVERLLKKRAVFLSDIALVAYGANEIEDMSSEEKDSLSETLKVYGPALLDIARIGFGIAVGESGKHVRTLKKRGVKIHHILPEYDVFHGLQDIAEFYGVDLEELDFLMKQGEIDIHIMELMTHGAAVGVRHKALAQVIKTILQK